jgi:hypothetical protein
VKWDQLALRAVTVGTGIHGLWYAAFNHEVRFVLIDGAEVDQSSFAPWAVVHLVVPFLVLAALVTGWLASRRVVDGPVVNPPAEVP